MFCPKKRMEIMPQVVDTTQKRITLNVGGQKHETYLSTIRNYPDTRLYWVVENVTKAIDYHSEKIELFFDRHPRIFDQVLNYYRTGKLHCPNDVCGPLFEEELAYWGIDEKEMEPCCWTTYTQHRDAEHNLKSFNVTDFSADIDSDKQDDSETTWKSKRLHPLWQQYQPKIWAILEEPRSSKTAKIFSIMSVALIVLSVCTSCAITLPQFDPDSINSSSSTRAAARTAFKIIEFVCGIWFTLELLLRLIFCPSKRAFLKSVSFWIDVLSVLPFYVRLLFPEEDELADALLVIRLLRLFRFFRLLYGLQVILHTLKASSYELFLLLLILLIPVVLFSSVIYYVEKTRDGKNTKFRSIPESFWWSLITMTTVGYGDMTPRTWEGKIIGGACAVFGVLMVALPISVIGSNFNLYYAHAQARLRLPRKKTKIHFDSIATAAMSRQAQRRKAIRRRSPGVSSNDDGTSLRSRANSAGRTSYYDARSWSMSSNRSVPEREANEIRQPTAKPKRKVSRERRLSRNADRSPPKLGDLIEHENEDAHSPTANNKFFLQSSPFLQPRLSLTVPREHYENRMDYLPVWPSSPDDKSRRLRSHSMPVNNSPVSTPRQEQLRTSRRSPICDNCSLPMDEKVQNGSIKSDISIGTCHCTEFSLKRPGSSTFTVLIPNSEGDNYDSMIEINTDNVPLVTKEMPCVGTSPVQLQFYSSENVPGSRESSYRYQGPPVVSSEDSEDEDFFSK